jgi:hypothetical protein
MSFLLRLYHLLFLQVGRKDLLVTYKNPYGSFQGIHIPSIDLTLNSNLLFTAFLVLLSLCQLHHLYAGKKGCYRTPLILFVLSTHALATIQMRESPLCHPMAY